MDEKRRIARRYARAFTSDGVDDAALDLLSTEAADITRAIGAKDGLHDFFVNPSIVRSTRLAVVDKIATVLGLSVYTRSLLEVLIRNDRIDLLALVSDELSAIADERLGRVRLKVTTAYEPSPAELNDITRRLGTFFGRKAIVERTIDPALIGGFTVEGDDTFVDMSVKGQISRIIERV